MIKVNIGNNAGRQVVLIPAETTLRQALEDYGIDYTRGATHLDGTTIQAGDFDKTFADYGITEKCNLLNVVKTDCA